MATIRKKIWPEYYDLIASGRKKHEYRLNDFEVKAGDILVFEEWDPKTKQYTGRKLDKKVTYVGELDIKNSFWSEKDIRDKGIIILSLE